MADPSPPPADDGAHRRRHWRRFAWIAAAVVAIPVVLAGIVVATVDADRLLPLLVRQVHERTGRTLVVAGGAALSLWPRPGLVIGSATLSEPGRTATFARVGSARLSAALMPLLRGRLEVDRVAIEGLRVDLVRRRDGSTNVDDLLRGPGDPASAGPSRAPRPRHWSIAGIDLRDASIGWRDERDGTSLRAGIDMLSTGEIGPGARGAAALRATLAGAAPALDLRVEGRGDYRIVDAGVQASDLSITAQGRIGERSGVRASVRGDAALDSGADAATDGGADAAAGASAAASGGTAAATVRGGAVDASGLRVAWEDASGLAADVSAERLRLSRAGSETRGLSARVRSASASGRLELKLALPDARATGAAFTLAPVVADIDWHTPTRQVTGRLQSPVALDLDARTATLAALRGALDASGTGVPGGRARIGVDGRVGVDAKRSRGDARLGLRLDEGQPGAARVDVGAVLHEGLPRRVEFDVTADRLDLDRWRPATTAAPKAPGKPPPDPKPSAGGDDLRARGRVRVGTLTVAGLSASALDATVAIAGRRIEVDPVRASLYGGRLAGRAGADLAAERWTLRQRLTEVSVGPLLRALSGRDLLEGRGTLDVDLATRGADADAMRRALGGSARLQLADGAIRGIDLAGALRRARAIASGQATEVAHAPTERTDFTSLTASFAIRDGVATNDDLDMRSPFLRLGGAGRIDAGAGTLDYLARVSLVASASGQGGQERDALRGLTVPVRVQGPLNAPRYRLELDRAVAGAAREALRERAREALQRQLPGAPADAGQLGDEIGRRLRGLFDR